MAEQKDVIDVGYLGPKPVVPPKTPILTTKQQLQQKCQVAEEKVQQAKTRKKTVEAERAVVDRQVATEVNSGTGNAASSETMQAATDAKNEVAKADEAVADAEAELDVAKEELATHNQEQQALLDISYIVHKAEITCSCGMEPGRRSYIVLKKDHGVYVKGQPQMHVQDVMPGLNFINFEGCTSPKNPMVQAAAIKTVETVQPGSKKAISKPPIDVEEVSVGECILTITGDTEWTDGKDDVKIDGFAPLMGKSKLTCSYGGIITITTSGQ